MRRHHTASTRGSVVILSDDFGCGRETSFLRMTSSRKQAELLAELHGLRPSFRSYFAKNTAGMGLDRVLADVKLRGDLAVARALGDQFQDLELAARDAKILSFSIVRDGWSSRRNRDFLHNDALPSSSQLQTEPDAKNGKGRRDQSAVDFDRMLDYREPILSPLEDGNQDPGIVPEIPPGTGRRPPKQSVQFCTVWRSLIPYTPALGWADQDGRAPSFPCNFLLHWSCLRVDA